MSNGWITLNRKLTDHWLWEEKPFTKAQAWIDLLLNAGHKDRKLQIKGRLISLDRGQQARSEVTLASTWGWSRDKVRRFLKLLESDGMIIQQKNNLTTILSICNYSSYQDIKQDDKKANDTAEKQEAIQQTNTRRYTNNNGNNGNKVIKVNGFKKPTIEEIEKFLQEKQITSFTAENFYNHYEANGWMRGRNKIKNWKACVNTWKSNNKTEPEKTTYREII